MKVPYFRAKKLNSNWYLEGFYFAYPETTHCFITDYTPPVKLIHCIATWDMTDWELPNQSRIVQIDPSTLEQIGEVNTDDIYYNLTK